MTARAAMSDAPALDDVLRATGVLSLGEDPPAEAIEASLHRLSEACEGETKVRRALLRERAVSAVRKVGISAAAQVVDAALGVSRSAQEDSAAETGGHALSDPEPWPEPVDGAALLDDIEGVLVRFVVLPRGAAVAVALWVLHAHAHDAAAVSPLLAITSPEKRCGKSTLLHLLGALVPRPLPASNITPAALYRAVQKFRPTLLVDEADTFLREREELRGVLNSGHARASAVVVRTVSTGDDFEVRTFSTWAAKAVALIDSGTTLPDTLRDRSVEVKMRRRAPGEEVDRLRLDRLADFGDLRRRCARWAADHIDNLRDADPTLPDELHDRAADNWRPLAAIGDAAGGWWPGRARRAALVLSAGRDDEEASAGVLLLGDLRRLFHERDSEKLASAEIERSLGAMEERPWPEWKRGDPITPRQIARLLRPFGVSPKTIRIGDSTPRGYVAEDFSEAWERYVPPVDPPSEAQHPQHRRNEGENGGSVDRNIGRGVADLPSGEDPHHASNVAGVAVGDPSGNGTEPTDADYARIEREAIRDEGGR